MAQSQRLARYAAENPRDLAASEHRDLSEQLFQRVRAVVEHIILDQESVTTIGPGEISRPPPREALRDAKTTKVGM